MSEKENFDNLNNELDDVSLTDTAQDADTFVQAVDSKKKSPLIVTLIDYAEVFAIALSVVLLLFSFVVRICEVKGPSMENTLIEGERLLVSNVGYKPKRGDIIVFHQTGRVLNEPVVKRVIATAGETVDIDFNDYCKITITDVNGNTFVLDEPYMKLDSTYIAIRSDYDLPFTVPEGTVYVMGDNRNHSTDSRSYLIGPVDERRILGKVIVRFAPFDKFGKVD